MPTYTCPVCGYDRLEEPPEDWSICPSCLTMFGYSDYHRDVSILREAWITSGAMWGSKYIQRPPFWDPVKQLRNIGYAGTEQDLVAIARHQLVGMVTFTIRSRVVIADAQQRIAQNLFVVEPGFSMTGTIQRLVGSF